MRPNLGACPCDHRHLLKPIGTHASITGRVAIVFGGGMIMWRTLTSRVYGCIAATLAIAFLVSVAAIVGLRSTAGSLDRILDDNLPSVVAAGELESALLEQRGYITTFMVSGGDEQWLDEL